MAAYRYMMPGLVATMLVAAGCYASASTAAAQVKTDPAPATAVTAVAPAAAAATDTPAAPAQRVTVAATRDPVDKSYRKMIAGMDRFERMRALAPQATLRFQLLPRLPGTVLDGITLRVAGDSVSLPVVVAPDHSFTLPRDARALTQDAALIASRKTSTLTWRAQVRSPGVPARMRRLGDLRLECQVGVAAGLVSNNGQIFSWLDELFTDPDRICGAPDGNYLFFAERPIFGVTAQDGARSVALPFDLLYAGGTQTAATLPYCDCQVLLDRSFYAPLWDRSWPDDTLLAFDDMDAPPTTTLAPGYDTTAAVRARLGPATTVRFDNGVQVWRYRYPQAQTHATGMGVGNNGNNANNANNGQPGFAEFVILFGPDGAARKARLTEPL